jgi:hypothetical protein
MTVESGTYISDFNASNPGASDPKSEGDDHLRIIKAWIKATFPNITGAVNPTQTELNFVVGATSPLGYRGLPAASVTTGAFVAADAGKSVYATAGVTVPNATMGVGDVVTIINTTSGNITITATVATLNLAGTASTGNRTLAQKGIATVIFGSSTQAYISGVGLS